MLLLTPFALKSVNYSRHGTIVERGVISQIELLHMAITSDNLTEEFGLIFSFEGNFKEIFHENSSFKSFELTTV